MPPKSTPQSECQRFSVKFALETREALNFDITLSTWRVPVVSVSCSLNTLDSSKKCRVVGLTLAVSVRKSSTAAVA